MDFIHELAGKNENFKEYQDEIIIELAQYIGKSEFFEKSYFWKTVDKIDPITWWRGYCSKLQFKKLAISLLTLPPSSAATERTFSKYGFIHSKKRNKLTIERAGKLTFVACNISLQTKNKTSQTEGTKEGEKKSDHGALSTLTLEPSLKRIRKNPENSESTTSSSDSDPEECHISLHDTNSSISPEDFSGLDDIEEHVQVVQTDSVEVEQIEVDPFLTI